MKQVTIDDTLYWQCEECGFMYAEKDLAEQCEAWCREHHACNNEITRHAIVRDEDGVMSNETISHEDKA